MEEIEKTGWVSEHQNTEQDIEFLNIQQVLDTEDDEPSADCIVEVLHATNAVEELKFSADSEESEKG